MKKKELVIVLLVLAFGLLYYLFESGNIDFYEGCSFNSRGLLYKKFFSFPQEEQRYTDIQSIEIHNKAGAINIEKSAGNETVVQPVIRVYHKKRDRAEVIRESIELRYRLDRGRLTIDTASNKNFPYQRVRIYFQLQVPEAVELNLVNRYGDIELKDTGRNVLLDGKHGDISVAAVNANLKIRHGYGRIVIRDVGGEVDLQTRYASLDIDRAAAVKIDSEHTKIKIRNIKKGILLKNSHHAMDIADVEGSVSISASDCRIRLKNVVSDYIIVKNAYKETRLKDITADNLDLSMSHGDLIVDFRHIDNAVNINGKYADIVLRFPGSLTPLFNVSTTYGEIKNRSSAQLDVGRGKVRQTVTSMEGEPDVIINSVYGDIILENSR
jgi:hypothetical protein